MPGRAAKGVGGALPAIGERHVEGFELLAQPTRSDAEREASTGQLVDGGYRLGEQHSRAQRNDQHTGPDAHPLGRHGDRRQQGERLRPRLLGPDRCPPGELTVRIGVEVAAENDVVGDEELVEPQRFDMARCRDVLRGRLGPPSGATRTA